MSEFVELKTAEWGYAPKPALRPIEIAERFAQEVREGIASLRILSIEHDSATDNSGFERVYANLCVSSDLFDLLLNGPCGYRAQYFASEEKGEAYNRLLVNMIAPVLFDIPRLYTENVTAELSQRSLVGQHTKFWFPKYVTSPDYAEHLVTLPAVIAADRWRRHWSAKAHPRKGLLAPVPDLPQVLMNGTFVHPSDWRAWNQKPDRAYQIWATGWT